jgi:DNA polymerase elongation subunit (family B)
MPRIIVFDIETRKWASDLRPDDHEAGWIELRAGKGGAAAIVVYDSRDGWLHHYDDHTAQHCARHIESADIVVGYNSDNFDIPCLEGLVDRRLRIRRSIDIYQMLIQAYAKRGISGQKGDFTLDAVSRRNLGRGKIDHGDNVKELIRRGMWARVFNYCADDVHLTRDLLNKLVADDGLTGLRGQFISLPTEGLS